LHQIVKIVYINFDSEILNQAIQIIGNILVALHVDYVLDTLLIILTVF